MQKKNDPKDFETRFKDCDKKFNTIFKLTSAASKIIASDLTILKVNDALAELLGYEAWEIEGTKILDHACEEYKEHWHELQTALWSKEVPFFKLQACLHRKDRAIVWVNLTTILYDDQGETYGFTVLDDFTGRKHFEESEKRLNVALKHSKMAVWELNMKTLSVDRSEGHDEIFGYEQPLADWTLESYFTHLWEEDVSKFQNAFSALQETGMIDLQLRLTTKDGSVKWVHFQGKADSEPYVQQSRILGTITDITRDKLVERHKDDFISIASHELKTPITSLKTSLQLLDRQKNDLAEQTQTLITLANKSVNKIVLLVDDLLNAGKTYKDQLELKKTTFNLYKLIEECSDNLRIEGATHIILTGQQDIEINADAERIERVMINLLTNAVKYAPESREIIVTIEQLASDAKVSVKDQGPGIPEEKLSLLFDRYYQANSDERQYSGLGLGLFISAEIIRKHGGTIGVDSTSGAGATFWFTIPL